MSSNYKNEIDNLKNNPVFYMSLANKELFHSNMLAYFLKSSPDFNGISSFNFIV